MLERLSGLKDLKFEPDPPDDDRAVQSVIDRKGRIVGWFTWEAERPATAMMNRLLPLVAFIVLGLIGFAALAMWQLSRLGLLLAKSEQQVHKLTYEDPLTGLPNHSQLFELLRSRPCHPCRRRDAGLRRHRSRRIRRGQRRGRLCRR